MINNDPNIYFAERKIRLVYQMWEFKYEAFVTIGGNCRGCSVMDGAHENFMESLYESNKGPYILEFKSDNGDVLEVEGISPNDEDSDGNESLGEFERDMEKALVLIEIVEITKEK